MLNTIYTNCIDIKHKQTVSDFCDSFGCDGSWINEIVYRIDVDERQRIQFKLSFASFEADLGSNISAISGIKDDRLMRIALACSTRYALGKMLDLSEVMIMCLWNKDNSLIDALQVKISDVSPEIIDTLKMYFNTNYNAVLAAKQLYLHRNTFNYRLNKFIDKTNMDVKNPPIAQFLHHYFILIERI